MPNYPASWEGLDTLLKDVQYSAEAKELKKAVILATIRPNVIVNISLSAEILGFLFATPESPLLSLV